MHARSAAGRGDRHSLPRPGAAVRAGIVVTGTEVLTGTISDSNGPWLSEQLAELGIDVAHILIVGDRPDDLEAALRFMAAEGMDLVVTSGGLGPTADDLTAEVVARFAGRELQSSTRRSRRRSPRSCAASRADSNSTKRRSARRTASRRWCRRARRPSTRSGPRPDWSSPPTARVVVVLPGPPRELQPMWPAALGTEPVREVRREGDAAARATRCGCSAIPESEIAKSLREIEADGVTLGAVEITTCLRRGEIEIDVRYRDEAAATADAVRAGLLERHERHLFSLDGETIDAQVAALLAGPAPGPRRVLQRRPAGGEDHRASRAPRPTSPAASVAYSNKAKSELLGVDQALIEAHGAVSPEVAEAMSLGALERFGADVAVAITGIAGPDGGTEEKPVGYVCFDARLADGHRDRPRTRHPRRPRGHPRTLGPGRDAPAADPPDRWRATALRRSEQASISDSLRRERSRSVALRRSEQGVVTDSLHCRVVSRVAAA